MAANLTNRNYILIDGVNSMDYGVWMFGHGKYGLPKRDITMIDIPGRSGALTIDNNRFYNIDTSYICCILRDTPSNLPAFKSLLLSKAGYRRIEDTFHPDEYRLGVYKGGQDVKLSSDDVMSSMKITFNCKPQRFLKSGERPIVFTGSGVIHNPTEFEALPFIRVYGTGTFTLGATSVQITETTDYIDIDSELQDAYRGLVNKNGCIVLPSGKFPSLPAGNTGVALGEGISRLEITPRFWTI